MRLHYYNYLANTSEQPESLCDRIVCHVLLTRIALLAFITSTVVLSILLICNPDPTPTHCPLTYEGSSNVISERRLQFFAQLEGWTLTHPIAPNCMVCPEPDRRPIWMAPSDICRRFGLDQTHPLCNSPTDNSQISHVKVCANMTQIIQAWNDGGCHYLSTEFNATLTVPNIGYDGTLFCALANGNINQMMPVCNTPPPSPPPPLPPPLECSISTTRIEEALKFCKQHHPTFNNFNPRDKYLGSTYGVKYPSFNSESYQNVPGTTIFCSTAIYKMDNTLVDNLTASWTLRYQVTSTTTTCGIYFMTPTCLSYTDTNANVQSC